MGSEGIRRAVKFTSRRELVSPQEVSKGQRCTAMLFAAIQAGILAPIVKATKEKIPFKQYKGEDFLAYADEVLIEDWRETDLGARLLKCIESGDFTDLFGQAFCFDQRYAFPPEFYKAIASDDQVECVGRFAYFDGQLYVHNEISDTEETYRCSEGIGVRKRNS